MSMPNPPIEDREEFLRDVEEFMRQRGVPFDRDAKASGRSIDLHQLYKRVLDVGGYDRLSGERMAWRGLVKEYNLPSQHEPAMTFQLKTVYYKNLAAYEIARAWDEEPPPREILEDLTAKGGQLRSRRTEGYNPHSRMAGIDSASNDGDDEPRRTPSRDGAVEEPGSGGRYPTRQLRHNPSRTQMYQPDSTPARPRSNFARTTSSPQPLPPPVQTYSHAAIDPRNAGFTLDKYEPRQPIALTLRPVTTPGSNPDIFYQRKAMQKAQTMPRLQPDPHYLDQLKHSTSPHIFQGPNIYVRCHLGLLSGIKEEEDFALFHLTKVSDERGDKFTFAGFTGLAEGLIKKALQITELVYGIQWDIRYDLPEGFGSPDTLNGCYGTPHLRETVQSLQASDDPLDVNGCQFADQFERINEAALVIRNMTSLETNAHWISKFKIFRDFLIIVLNLPRQARLIELRQYALEMAADTTRYWTMESDDPLYLSLLRELDFDDRGRLLSALKAIFYIGADTEAVFNIANVPIQTIQRLISFVLLDDDELVEASLKFLYAWLANNDNVTEVLRKDPQLLVEIVPHITGKLLHNATQHEEKIQKRPFQPKNYVPATVPRIPNDLFQQLLQYPEPERSSRWLRCCFQESPEDDITQIAIWQAYSSVFEQARPIPAAEFIKNVSTTFTQAQAQVIQTAVPARFIIKGIKPRRILVDTQGRPYYKCLWEQVLRPNDPPQHIYDANRQQHAICGQWANSRQNLWYHIMIEHLKIPHDGKGKLVPPEAPKKNTPQLDGSSTGEDIVMNGESKVNGESIEKSVSEDVSVSDDQKKAPPTYTCLWPTCSRRLPITGTKNIANHVRMHLPENVDAMSKLINDAAAVPTAGQPRIVSDQDNDLYTRHRFHYTMLDERGHPAGIPYISMLALTALARYVSRNGRSVNVPSYLTSPKEKKVNGVGALESEKDIAKGKDLMARLFPVGVRLELFRLISVHRTLVAGLVDLMNIINSVDKESGKKRTITESEEHGGEGLEVNATA